MPIINTIIAGGSSPVIDPLNVTPSTSAQTITAPTGVDGYSPVNVSAVTSSIDANITAGNIKDGVQILGVTGNYTGTTPTGTKSITANGVYDVTNFASADVQVPTTAPTHYIEKVVDANGKLTQANTFIDMSGVTDIGAYALMYAYNQNTTQPITVSMPDLEQVTGTYACAEMLHGATLSLFSLPKLKKVTGQYVCKNMCQEAKGTGIEHVNLPELETVSGSNCCSNMFSASLIVSLTMNKLVGMYGSNAMNTICSQCYQLTAFNVPSLRDILTTNGGLQSGFTYSRGLVSLSFPALKNLGSGTEQFKTMCQSISGITIHFPSNMQTAVEALQGYSTTAPFGATAGTVLFDLPATVILTGANSQTYERSPKDDTGTVLAWRKQDTGTAPNFVIDWTPFYTSGTTDPVIGDTIYSDSACTTVVTTIDSIA